MDKANGKNVRGTNLSYHWPVLHYNLLFVLIFKYTVFHVKPNDPNVKRILYYNKLSILVPFRDSVLTKLLKNALGGNSKTMMVRINLLISAECVTQLVQCFSN